MSLPYKQELILRTKELRKNATHEERKLWYEFLRKYPIRFQRQKTISTYIVDFYCHAAKLAVELDGDQHGETGGLANDAKRDRELQRYGLYVLRIPNDAVTDSFDSVCELIDRTVRIRLGPADAAKLPAKEVLFEGNFFSE